MRRSLLLVWMILLVVLALGACSPDVGRVEPTPQPTLTPTKITITVERVTEQGGERTLQPVNVSPTPQETPSPEREFTGVNCDDTFCLVPWAGWLVRPIGEGFRQVSDRSYPYASTGGGEYDLHHGVELLNSFGTPVLAAQDGEVVVAGMDDVTKLGPYNGFYGHVVVLRHQGLISDGVDVYSLYAHLSEVGVDVGDRVLAGEVIGKVGASGAAFGSHLHFEVRVGQNDYASTVNPMLWFPPLDEAGHPEMALLAGLVLDRNGSPMVNLPLTLEKITPTGAVEAYFYPTTYDAGPVNPHPLAGENFVVPDIPAGDYRLAFIAGRFHEYFFSLEPGTLGFIKVQLD
jgi:murein DD-endopeptidase MepM/ murein hydrolase activator NlpD